MRKNVASQVTGAQMVSATDGSAFTGTATVVVTIDGGTQSASGGTGPTHEGNGFHSYVPTQAETNGDHIAFTYTGTGAVPVTVQVYTTFPQTGDNFARLGAPSGASVSADILTVAGRLPATLIAGRMVADVYAISGDAPAADNAESFFDGTGYAGTGNTIPTVTTLTGHTPQTGDSYARLGAPAGLSVSADILAVKGDTAAVLVDTADMQPKLGTPAVSVSADIAAVKVDTAAVLVDTADMQPKLGTPAVTVSADIAAVKVDTAAVLVDTADMQPKLGAPAVSVSADIAALNNLSAAQVNAEVVDVLTVDTQTLPGQTAPTATPTFVEAVMFLYKAWRNRTTQTAAEYKLYADDATTVDQKATVSDDATTFDKGETGTGP